MPWYRGVVVSWYHVLVVGFLPVFSPWMVYPRSLPAYLPLLEEGSPGPYNLGKTLSLREVHFVCLRCSVSFSYSINQIFCCICLGQENLSDQFVIGKCRFGARIE